MTDSPFSKIFNVAIQTAQNLEAQDKQRLKDLDFHQGIQMKAYEKILKPALDALGTLGFDGDPTFYHSVSHTYIDLSENGQKSQRRETSFDDLKATVVETVVTFGRTDQTGPLLKIIVKSSEEAPEPKFDMIRLKNKNNASDVQDTDSDGICKALGVFIGQELIHSTAIEKAQKNYAAAVKAPGL